MLARLGDPVENHLDIDAPWQLIRDGAPSLPTIPAAAYDRQS
jgi:hypothetical protein